MDIAGGDGGLSETDAYKVQFAVHDKISAGGADTMAGWKVALTLPAPVRAAEAVRPGFACIYQSGIRQSGAAFETGISDEARHRARLVARIEGRARGAPTPPTIFAAMSRRSIAAWSWSTTATPT